MEKEIIKALNEHRIFDEVANDYYQMTKEELKTLFMETYWAAVESLSDEDRDAFDEKILENLNNAEFGLDD